MKSFAPFWKGNLKKSIQGYKTRNGYVVHMNFYGRMVDEGHFIKVAVPYLKSWGFAKLSNPQRFFRMIYWSNKNGTPYRAKAQPFIQPAIDLVESNIDSISVDIINKTRKEARL